MGYVGRQVDRGGGALSHRRRHGIDAATLDPVTRDHPFAPADMRAGMNRNPLDRLAEEPRHRRRPGHPEPHVGGAERRDPDARPIKDRDPGGVRSQARPTGAAQGQNRHPRGQIDRALRRAEQERRIQPSPPPARPQIDAARAQPRQPSPQQRRGFHSHRKHAAGRAGEQLDAQPLGPGHDFGGAERPLRQHGSVVSANERGERLVAGQVQARLARHQELARRRGHRLGHDDRPAGCHQRLGRHQARGARADHQRVDGLGHRRPLGFMARRRRVRSTRGICGVRLVERSVMSVSRSCETASSSGPIPQDCA